MRVRDRLLPIGFERLRSVYSLLFDDSPSVWHGYGDGS